MTVQLHKPKILYVYAAFFNIKYERGEFIICIYYVKYIKLKLRGGNMYVSMDFKKRLKKTTGGDLH